MHALPWRPCNRCHPGWRGGRWPPGPRAMLRRLWFPRGFWWPTPWPSDSCCTADCARSIAAKIWANRRQRPRRRLSLRPPLSSASSASLASSFLPGPVAAVFDKELRYLYRNSMTALSLVLPLLLIIIFSFTWSGPRKSADLITRSPELAFPGAVAYMFLILAPFAHNSFAFDGRGIQLLLVAPVRFRAVLLGKNLLFGLIVAVETAVVWLMVSILSRPPGAWIALTTIAGVLFALLIHFIVGNWLSLAFPRKFEFAQYRRRASGVSVLVGLLLQIALMGFFAIAFVLARGFRRAWLLPVILFILSAIAMAAYRVTLDRFTRLASEKREVLITQLCK